MMMSGMFHGTRAIGSCRSARSPAASARRRCSRPGRAGDRPPGSPIRTAMLLAEAELGMPSQPLTATPPFFHSVRSLFSRKAFLPIFGAFQAATMGMAAPEGQSVVALDPPCECAGLSGFPHYGGPLGGRRAHSKSVTHDAEQEESDAAAYAGEGRLERAERLRRHRCGRGTSPTSRCWTCRRRCATPTASRCR